MSLAYQDLAAMLATERLALLRAAAHPPDPSGAAALAPRMGWLFAERATVRRAIERWAAPDAWRERARKMLDAQIEADLCRVLVDDVAVHLEAMGISAARIGRVRASLRGKARRVVQATAEAAREMVAAGRHVGKP